MSDLRQRLEDALAPHTGSDGPGEGVPTDAVLRVLRDWLRVKTKAEVNAYYAGQRPDARALPVEIYGRLATEVEDALRAAGP